MQNKQNPQIKVWSSCKLLKTLWLRIFVFLFFPLVSILIIHCKGYCWQILTITCAFALSAFITSGKNRLGTKITGAIYALMYLVFTVCILARAFWISIDNYIVPDNACRNPGFHGKILVLAPHQDDELNIIGGALEIINQDGDSYFLYYADCGETRSTEAIQALELFGIKKENISFLSYHDGGFKSSKAKTHMYNRPKDEIQTIKGKIATRSYPNAKCYREGRTCTQRHFEEDLRDYIVGLRPDIIICVDFDLHGDHRALGLTTERVLCGIMKDDASYRPTVLKSFAYSGAFHQPKDFYAQNLKCTQYQGINGNMPEVSCYRWNERLRIPVGKSSVTRSLSANLTASSFNRHVTQHTDPFNNTNERICNGDKIFWWRPTCNLMWLARVSSSSGDASQLCDFLLFDSENVADWNRMPYDHGWRPDGGKGEAVFSWESPVVIKEIHLFDQNDPTNQIKHMTITLSNGKALSVGPLSANGARVIVPTECSEPLSGFSIRIDDSSGEGSGLAEVEAYTETPAPPFQVAKLEDGDENFMYDYTTEPCGDLPFNIYTWGCSAANLTVVLKEASGEGIVIEQLAGGYKLHVPKGGDCVIEIRDEDGTVVDAAHVSNPNLIVRTCRGVFQKIDPYMVRLSWVGQYSYYSKLFAWLKSCL